MPKTTNSHRPHRGVTILEALVVLGVTAAVLLIVTSVSVSTNRSFRRAVAQRDATVAAERALDQLTRDLRAAQVGVDGSYPLATADDQVLVLLSDVNGDGAAEWVRYAIADAEGTAGGRLERSVAEAMGDPARYDPATATTATVARGIRNGARPVFEYFNADYPRDRMRNPLPTPSRLSDTRHIRVQLDVNFDPPATPTTSVVTAVTLRNLREGG